MPGTFTGTPGPWIAHYTYDGLGRLIRKQSPWPTLDPYGRVQVRAEHYYYDGVRRVQEVITDPLPTSDNTALAADAEAALPPLATQTATAREYIHSPGYVDEYVAQVDISASPTGADRPAWVIQDANYNVVALIADDGQMLQQYTWDAYGQPIAIDRYDTGSGAAAPFANRIGHQGLFFDRFDGGVSNVLLDQLAIDPSTGLGVKGAYQNRNRTYQPDLGRFAQRDQNASSVSVLHQMAKHGQGVWAQVASCNIMSGYEDGLNLYQYLRSTPSGLYDPLGTSAFVGEYLSFGISLGLGAFRGGLENMLGEYGDNMEHDLDWAGDWSMPDDWHTRGNNDWVGQSWREGMQRGVNGAFADQVDPFGLRDLVFARFPQVSPISVVRSVAAGGRLAGRLARNFHHAFPKFFASLLGKSSEVLVHMPAGMHKQYHAFLDKALRHRIGNNIPSMYDPRGKKVWLDWMDRYPDLVPQIIPHIREATANFANAHQIVGLVEAFDQAIGLAK